MLAGVSITKAEVTEAGATITFEANGKTHEVAADKVLMAAGRAVNTEGLGLDAAGIELTPQGFIKVNERLETSAAGYYAIGDIAGPPMLAHKGSREGVVAAEVIAGHAPPPIRYDNIPEMPLFSFVEVPHREEELFLARDMCRAVALELRANEVYNYSFVPDQVVEAVRHHE